jgi:diphosphomevalonate decarboxylase
MKASARAGANIAFVKYWGQADPELNLPLNNSLSMTLDNAFTLTTVEFVPGPAADAFVLNGELAGEAATRRVTAQLDRLRALAALQPESGIRHDPAASPGLNPAAWRARVESRNSFPTGAGIASSASGFAALTLAAAAGLGLDLTPAELSALARLASGSACRSLFGGYVEWLAGTGHADSYAVQVAPPEHWRLMDAVAVVSGEAKVVPSEAGHRLASTSPFLAARLATVGGTLAACRAAILARDLVALGEAAEAEALSLHAVALTSRPSVWYWNCGTQAVIEAVRAWRREGLPAYFTIDAGPNVHILTLPEHLPAVRARLAEIPAVKEVIVCGPGPGATLLSQHLF